MTEVAPAPSRQPELTTRASYPGAPPSASEQAREFLAAPPFVPPPFPELSDTAGWDEWIGTLNELSEQAFLSSIPPASMLQHESFRVGEIDNYVLTPTHASTAEDSPLFIFIHGGGLVLNGGAYSWREAIPHALGRNGVTWSPDYRMPPHHPFPTGLNDLVDVYREALKVRAPEQIIVSGASAGGNLAVALMLRLREEGLPFPAGLVLLSPHVDLTESGDSFITVAGIDPALTMSLKPASILYADGEDLTHPLLSPLFGDLHGLPPTYLQSGTRDLLLSSTLRLHRSLLSAGVHAELHVFDAMPHVAFTGSTPEDEEALAEARRFEAVHLK